MYGDRVHRAVLDADLERNCVTLHVVNAEYDTGPVVAVAPVAVLPGDTPASLGPRVKAKESALVGHVLRAIAQDEIDLEDYGEGGGMEPLSLDLG